MKWCFLVNDAQFLFEFMGKLAFDIQKSGDEYFVVINSKIAEYEKMRLFPKGTRFISRVDWCLENYKKDKMTFEDLSWHELFSIYDRYRTISFSYENSFLMLSSTHQFFEHIFSNEKPDILVSEPPAGLFHQVADYFAKKHNATYLGIATSRIQNHLDVYDAGFTSKKYQNLFDDTQYVNIPKDHKGEAVEFVKGMVNHTKLPSYVNFSKVNISQIGLIKHFILKIKESGSALFKYFLSRNIYKKFDYESEAILGRSLRAPLRWQLKKARIFSQKSFFEKMGDDKFFLFPLHLQPEATTSVMAPHYTDQLNAAINIAFSLPFPYLLYVREHPAAVGSRESVFYEALRKLPDVKIISPYENIEELVKRSSGVITLTGTVGLEAALSGKPAYVLGNVFYSYHPFCRKVKNFYELKSAISKDILNPPSKDSLEEINARFFVSYLQNTVTGNIAWASDKNDKNDYSLIVKSLKSLINSY